MSKSFSESMGNLRGAWAGFTYAIKETFRSQPKGTINVDIKTLKAAIRRCGVVNQDSVHAGMALDRLIRWNEGDRKGFPPSGIHIPMPPVKKPRHDCRFDRLLEPHLSVLNLGGKNVVGTCKCGKEGRFGTVSIFKAACVGPTTIGETDAS